MTVPEPPPGPTGLFSIFEKLPLEGRQPTQQVVFAIYVPLEGMQHAPHTLDAIAWDVLGRELATLGNRRRSWFRLSSTQFL